MTPTSSVHPAEHQRDPATIYLLALAVLVVAAVVVTMIWGLPALTFVGLFGMALVWIALIAISMG